MSFNEKLKLEIKDFREIGHKFVSGEVSVGDFKGISGGMGVYAQRGKNGFMIRLRTSSGIISNKHLNLINSYVDKYNLEAIHLTTRQAVQLHNLGIDDVCDIMEDAIDNNLYTRGAGGNFPRNVSLSPLSGVEKGEAFDVTSHALLASEYLMDNITSYKLPRKLKIAFSNSSNDEGKASVNDLGFIATLKDGKPYFKVFLAGGLGNNPAVAIKYNKLVEPKDVLYHVEAIIRLFVAEGDYENKSKARIRYIPRRMGVEEFLNCYESHLQAVKNELKLKELDAVVESFVEKDNSSDTPCLISQKQNGLYTVVIHPISGQLLKDDLKTIVDFVNEYENAEIRLSMEENMYIRNLLKSEAEQLLEITKHMRQDTKFGQSVSCIGVPTCQIGIEKSQALLQNILNKVRENNIDENLLPSIHISGCLNSCSRHQISDIGFSGCKKRVNDNVEEGFNLFVGGFYGEEEASLGKEIGFIPDNKIPEFICDLAIDLNKTGYPFKKYLKEKENEFYKLATKYTL